jgi:hypothetical protein
MAKSKSEQKNENALKRKHQRKARILRRSRKFYDIATMPAAIFYLTYSQRVHPAYNVSWLRRMRLGFRFFRNYYRITSGTSWRAHLAIAMRLLETPPGVKGDVVECGCWKGGATVNLSLASALVNRRLRVYDSFEGLPPPKEGDHVAQRVFAKKYYPHVLKGSMEEVTANVRRLGAIGVCSFHKGYFEDTLPHHEGPIVLAFWDVDLYASLHDCLLNLWRYLVDGAYLFMDEYRNVPYCSVFFSEKYWRKYFDCDPPGLIGIGTGIQVGMFYTDSRVGAKQAHLHRANSTAYTRKGNRAIWDYYPDEFEQSKDSVENVENNAL